MTPHAPPPVAGAPDPGAGGRLALFTAFHANLDFSAMPEADRSTVIARCYWPLLALPEEHGIRIGFEASARTLAILEREDPEWTKRFRGLAERGLVEPIASGWAQVVAPLAPIEVNRANLRLGMAAYERLLGARPSTFFVNEQTWSDGLAPLYAEAGAERVVMEWNNPASRRPELRALRCRPARLAIGAGEPGPVVLWNDSIVFQKLQRLAHGQIPWREVESFLDALASRPGAQALCVYGGDVEIFDYRPSRPVPEAARRGESEMERLIAAFRALAADPRFAFVLPREVVPSGAEDEGALPTVELGSAEDPIPCKKQPRYNPTRWAVSGRGGFAMNTRCHALWRLQRGLEPGRDPTQSDGESTSSTKDPAQSLVDLWRSDFRTRATEEKIEEFEARLGRATEAARVRLDETLPALAEGEDLLLANDAAEAWPGLPVGVPVRLAAGRARALALRTRRGAPLSPDAVQVEVTGRHRDGSIREATLVLCPQLPPRSLLACSLVPIEEAPAPMAGSDEPLRHHATPSVEAAFLPHRGSALEALAFPTLGGAPLAGTIPHGRFDRIDYTPDFYSGHVIAVTENGAKLTDLTPAALRVDPEASGPVRTTLRCAVTTALGPWQKTYRLYHAWPRLDVVHALDFHDARLESLRLGLCTLLPDAWRRETLRYGTTHGAAPEWRPLAGAREIAQSRAVSPAVSAHSCLGATEGWVAFEDDRRGLLIQADRAEAAVAPMLDFDEVDDSFFLRLTHTAAESDETRASFLRGRRRFAFAFEGYDPASTDPAARGRQRDRGLLYRTETNLGITSGL